MSIFGNNRNNQEDDDIPVITDDNRINGKIYHLEEDKGWGFISSPEIEFTRIFFHWTGLSGDTKNFKELKKGDKVEFTPVTIKDEQTGEEKVRAIRIKVIE